MMGQATATVRLGLCPGPRQRDSHVSRREGAREERERLKREGGAGQDPRAEAGEAESWCPQPGNPGEGRMTHRWPPSQPLGGGLAGLTVPRSADTAPLFGGPARGRSGRGPRLAGKGPGPCPSFSSSLDRQEAAGWGGRGLPPAHCPSPSQGSCGILHASHTPRARSQSQPGGESRVQGHRPAGAPARRPAPTQTAAHCPHPAIRSPQDTPTAQSGQGAVPSGDLGAGGAGLCSLGTPDPALPHGVGSSRQGPQPPQPRATWPQLSVQHPLPTPTVGPVAPESLPRP